MTRASQVALIVFFCFISSWSQVRLDRSAAKQVREQSADASLQLTASVVEQVYCTGGRVRMFLRLKYTNTGSEPIILWKTSIAISRSTVSPSEKAAAIC
jgi:hypothetical protein